MISAMAIESCFDRFSKLIGSRTGIVLTSARRSDVEDGLKKIMAKNGITDFDQCLYQLENDPLLLDKLIAEITIGETYFFREPAQYTYIRDEIIPKIRGLRSPKHVMRTWSAGCASGEEAYSLAILFDEAELADRVHILATDISRTALALARKADYGGWSLRGEGARLIGLYLKKKNNRFKLIGRIRRLVEFAYLNLAQDIYPTFSTNTWGIDLILCRNVLIYMDTETIRAVARRLYNALGTGGYLITGPSDPLLGDYADFEILTTPAGLIYRRPATAGEVVIDKEPARPRMKPAPIPMPLVEPRPSASSPNTAAKTRAASARNNKVLATESNAGMITDVEMELLNVRALANSGEAESAVAAAARTVANHPASTEAGYLYAILLMNQQRYTEARQMLKRVIYLDRSLAVAHFAMAAIFHSRSNINGARRAYRNARDIAACQPADSVLALSDGELAGRFVEAVNAQIEALDFPRDGDR